jgi:diacylglycerol kinase family enzyme
MAREGSASVPLGLIPGGAGNTVAQQLGCLDPVLAAQRILAGQPRPLDLALVTCGGGTTFCINIVDWGAAVDISQTAERLRWLGSSRYTLSALLTRTAG